MRNDSRLCQSLSRHAEDSLTIQISASGEVWDSQESPSLQVTKRITARCRLARYGDQRVYIRLQSLIAINNIPLQARAPQGHLSSGQVERLNTLEQSFLPHAPDKELSFCFECGPGGCPGSGAIG